jgi:hypothetical protein
MSQSLRNRDRKPGRRQPYRDPRPIILIVCEGKNTEPQDLEGFWKACHNPRVRIEPVPGSGVPLTLVKVARDRKRSAEKDAKRRAQGLCVSAQADSEAGRNPTTTIYRLTHEIERTDRNSDESAVCSI